MRKHAFFLLVNFLILFQFSLSAEQGKWDEYFQNTLHADIPHRVAYLADQYFVYEGKAKGRMADLGAGTGRDTLFFLKHGWKVFATDSAQLAIDIILSRVDPSLSRQLEVAVMPFSEMHLPNQLDLIHAGFSLPFCKPDDFPTCWSEIVDHLAVGGRFSGHFFGKKDDWASDPDVTIHSYEAFLKLFDEQFKIEYLQIEEGLIPAADRELRHWHIYHVVAKKIK